MSTNTHLIELERELEADLAEARRHIELGRKNAIDELNAHRGTLGELCGEAALKIDLLASDADEDLKGVRARLGELNLLLAVEEIKDLDTFDQFRDRILRAMADAEEDLDKLNLQGGEWGAREQKISDAWGALSRQLSLARLHLVHESQLAEHEFEAEREELAAHLEELREIRENHRPKQSGDLLGKVGHRIEQLLPGLKTLFLYEDTTVPPERHKKRHGERHD
jgi:hypothetical protein